jgi:O-antigen ligase
MANKIIFYLLILSPPLIFYTAARDHFLIKNTAAQLLGVWLLLYTSWHKNKSYILRDRTAFAISFFLIVTFLSSLQAKYPLYAIRNWLNILILAVTFLYAKYFASQSTIENIAKFIILVSCIVSLYAILQKFNIDIYSWETNFGGRPGSTFGNPNFLAGYLGVTLPISLSTYLQTANFFYLIAALLIFSSLLFTGTRGAWIACAVSLVIFFASAINTTKKLKKHLIYVFVFLVVCILITTPFVISRIRNLFNMADPSVKERIFKWMTAYEIFKDKPLLGTGLGNLKVHYAIYQAKVRKKNMGIALRGTSESNVHNDYLQLLSETGVFGIMGYISIFVIFFYSFVKKYFSYKSLKDNTQTHAKYLSAGFIAGISFFLIYSLSNFPLSITPTAITLFFYLGSMENLYLLPDENKVFYERDPSEKNNLFLQIVKGIIYLSVIYIFVIPPFIAEIYRYKAELAERYNDLPAAIKYYNKAIRTDFYRSEFSTYYLGMIYVRLGNYDDAIEMFKKSISLRNYGEVYNDLGNCYYLKRDFQNALKNWEIALYLGLPTKDDEEKVKNNINVVSKLINDDKT